MRKIGIGFLQIVTLCLYTVFMNQLSTNLHLGIPGSILGLIVLFLLLKFNIVKLKWIEIGGNWLVAELLLFFIPSAVGVMQYGDLMMHNGVKIMGIIFICSAVVMTGTGLVAEKIGKQKEMNEHDNDLPLSSSHH